MVTNDLPKTRSAGGVVVNSRGEVAIVNQNGTSWSLPKGHLVGDETELAAAVREIYEETGISKITFVRKLGSYERLAEDSQGRREMKTITMFLFTTSEVTLAPRDPANPLALWVRPDSVHEILSNPTDQAFFDRIIDCIGIDKA